MFSLGQATIMNCTIGMQQQRAMKLDQQTPSHIWTNIFNKNKNMYYCSTDLRTHCLTFLLRRTHTTIRQQCLCLYLHVYTYIINMYNIYEVSILQCLWSNGWQVWYIHNAYIHQCSLSEAMDDMHDASVWRCIKKCWDSQNNFGFAISYKIFISVTIFTVS